MLKPWEGNDSARCFVLCAGRGTRMNDQTADSPKVMAEINGKPLIHYVVDYWRQFTEDFVFIVGYKKEMVMDYVLHLPIRSAFIEQKERKGIANAILQAEGEVFDRFIMVLGDCICQGEFAFPDGMDQGVGVCRKNDVREIMLSYSVELEGGLIRRVVEKPKILVNDLCGMGFYFFGRKVFDYIRKTPPSALRNEVEITDVIQNMISAGEPVSPVWFNGDYMNVTFPEDLQKARSFITVRT